MGKFQSTKVFDGFSTVFRQWKAEGTHCKFLHGYGVSLKVWFEGELDERNWVWDFGGYDIFLHMYNKIQQWKNIMFTPIQTQLLKKYSILG
jgi:6-pyruvoyltetrahydropterin/6-carboxytetrahydropterin synthase